MSGYNIKNNHTNLTNFKSKYKYIITNEEKKNLGQHAIMQNMPCVKNKYKSLRDLKFTCLQ